MWRKILPFILMLILVMPLQAQVNSPLVAFINNSNQLVVSSADGVIRWIITNPGEVLHPTLGYTWSPNGNQIFFAVDFGGAVSLRVAVIPTMELFEIGQASGQLSGGEWVGNDAVLIAQNDALIAFPNGEFLIAGQPGLTINSPFTTENPHLAEGQGSYSPQGLIYEQNNVDSLLTSNGQNVQLPTANNPTILQMEVPVWSDILPLVAYSGIAPDGNSMLAVTDTTNQNTISFNSGRGTPFIPIGWITGTTQLLYRDATGVVKVADLGCVSGGCGANPFDLSIEILPISVTEVQIESGWLFYVNGDTVMANNLNCVAAGDCMTSAVVLGSNAAPRTILHVVGNTLVYTAYSADPNNPNDREIRLIDLVCLPNCQPRVLLSGAVSGFVSPDGQYITADIIGNGLNIVGVADSSLIFLSGSTGVPGENLRTARWN